MKHVLFGLVAAAALLGILPAAEAFAPRVEVPFTGTLDLKGGGLSLVFGRGENDGNVLLVITRLGGGYDLKVDIRHVPVLGCDMASVVTGHVEFLGSGPLSREISGDMASRYTLVNYKPVRDGRIKFTVRQRHLTVDPFWIGAVFGKADIDLAGTREMDVALEVLSADLGAFMEMLRERGVKVPPFSGIVTGDLQLKGPMGKPHISGRLSAYNGRLKNFGYDTLDLKFEGAYPFIRLEEGLLVASEGPSFRVTGALDVSDMARLGGQIRGLKRDFVIADDENSRTWVISRLQGSGEHTTQLKSFISGNADGRGDGERVIGFQKQIGF